MSRYRIAVVLTMFIGSLSTARGDDPQIFCPANLDSFNNELCGKLKSEWGKGISENRYWGNYVVTAWVNTETKGKKIHSYLNVVLNSLDGSSLTKLDPIPFPTGTTPENLAKVILFEVLANFEKSKHPASPDESKPLENKNELRASRYPSGRVIFYK